MTTEILSAPASVDGNHTSAQSPKAMHSPGADTLAGTCAAAYSPAYVWYVIILLAVVNAFNYMDRMALAVLLPLIKADLQLSDGQLGLLVGLAFSVFYAICGVPIARWADRGKRKNIISLAIAVWSVMTALSGAAQNFWQLFIARVGVGAGEAGCIPPSQSMLCDYVPLERRSGVFAINTLGLIMGLVIGMALAGWMGERVGWRWAFVILGVPGLALALLVKSTLQEPSRGNFDKAIDSREHSSLGETAGRLWHCRTYRFLACMVIMNGFLQFGFNQWWPSFYERLHNLSVTTVGAYLGIAIAAGSSVGLLAGGFLANKAARRNIKLPLVISAIATTLALPTLLASLFIPSAAMSILLVGTATALWSVSNGPILAYMVSIVRPCMRATAGSITILFTSVFGFGLGPLCVGLLSDLLNPSLGLDALRYALLVPAAMLPLMVLAIIGATRTLADDLRAAGASVVKNLPDRTI